MQKTFARLTGTLVRAALVGGIGLLGCGNPAVSNNGGGSGNAGSNGSGAGGSNGNGIVIPPSSSAGNTGTAGGSSGTEPSNNNNCGVKKIDLQKAPADLLVLDRSRSMLEDVSGGNGRGGRADAGVMGPAKWTEVVAAIDPVINSTQAQVAWGLKLFPLADACGVPAGATVPVATNGYTAIMGAIKANDPGQGTGGRTPTRLAVEKSLEVMLASTSANSKYLVIATDGLPNCGQNGNGDDAAGAINAVAAAAAAGIESFVVGIATAGSDAHDTLNQMAVKGGRPRNDATKYYPVASKDELVSALESITGQVASCTFPLSAVPPVPDNVAVGIDGKRIARDTTQTSGWNYGPQDKSIVLYGSDCDGLKTGAAKNVQILYGCPGASIN